MDKVLLVNDCRLESIIMKDTLSSIGYDVAITNEFEALREVRELSPDILICNLIMKETSGNKLIEKVKLLYPDIKCYLSSNNPIKLEDYRRNRVDDVIHTPLKKDAAEKLLMKKQDLVSVNMDKPRTEEILLRLMNKGKASAEDSKKSGQELKVSKNVETIPADGKKMQFCPYCGQKLDGEERGFIFCPFCGSKF